MDVVHGRLSDYPVLADDVVTVQVTLPRGGLVLDRIVPGNTGPRSRLRQTSKPQPTLDPTIPPQGSSWVEERTNKEEGGMDSRSYDKIKQTFKCSKFSGQPNDGKPWNKGFQRYLSIWELDHVLDLDFFNEIPLSKWKIRDNKLVYYIIEDATQGSPLTPSLLREASSGTKWIRSVLYATRWLCIRWIHSINYFVE